MEIMAKPHSTKMAKGDQRPLKHILRVYFPRTSRGPLYLRVLDPTDPLATILQPAEDLIGFPLEEAIARQANHRITLSTPYNQLRIAVVEFDGEDVRIADVSIRGKPEEDVEISTLGNLLPG